MSIEPEAVLMNQVIAAAERHSGNFVEGWREILRRPRRVALQAADNNADARARSFREVGLSEAQAGLRRMSEGRSVPGTTIQSIRPTRGVAATGPAPERKPGESPEAFRVRLRKQILDLGKRANSAPSLPSDNTSSSYSERKEALMNDAVARVREVSRNAGRSKPAPSTGALTAKAHQLMQSRKQAIDPRSAGFSENFKAALAELA